jgi:hypothetical protein
MWPKNGVFGQPNSLKLLEINQLQSISQNPYLIVSVGCEENARTVRRGRQLSKRIALPSFVILP